VLDLGKGKNVPGVSQPRRRLFTLHFTRMRISVSFKNNSCSI
jgi:hypothetical protein